jgi:hypothetical protein
MITDRPTATYGGAPVERTGASSPAEEDEPFYRRASFWAGPFTIGLGLVVAVGLAIAWYELGGLPRDHDRYGEVEVPGQAVFALPAGDVRLNLENHATRSGGSTTLDDRPPGLEVRVTPAAGGGEVAVEDVPGWLYSSTSGDRGHEPLGKIDVPKAGEYLVAASDDRSGRPRPPAGGAEAPAKPPSVDSGPAISVGQSPWTPFDSKLAGAILFGVVVMLGVGVLFVLPFRLFIPHD